MNSTNMLFIYTLTGHLNDIEILDESGVSRLLTGDVQTVSQEFEVSFQHDAYSMGFNHSYLRLNDWNFNARTVDGQSIPNISCHDYLIIDDHFVLDDQGESLRR